MEEANEKQFSALLTWLKEHPESQITFIKLTNYAELHLVCESPSAERSFFFSGDFS